MDDHSAPTPDTTYYLPCIQGLNSQYLILIFFPYLAFEHTHIVIEHRRFSASTNF